MSNQSNNRKKCNFISIYSTHLHFKQVKLAIYYYINKAMSRIANCSWDLWVFNFKSHAVLSNYGNYLKWVIS